MVTALLFVEGGHKAIGDAVEEEEEEEDDRVTVEGAVDEVEARTVASGVTVVANEESGNEERRTICPTWSVKELPLPQHSTVEESKPQQYCTVGGQVLRMQGADVKTNTNRAKGERQHKSGLLNDHGKVAEAVSREEQT